MQNAGFQAEFQVPAKACVLLGDAADDIADPPLHVDPGALRARSRAAIPPAEPEGAR